jgi:ketosteroid isomerase-like protein
MPPNSAVSVGHEAIREAYRQLFQSIRLIVKFEIAEIHQVAENWAFARTNSTSTALIHATGAAIPDANHELFIFQKIASEWKIARYCFSTINPPQA